MFGFPRLRALVAEQGEEGSLGDFCLEKLYSFVGEGWEQKDDITLLPYDAPQPQAELPRKHHFFYRIG